MEQSAHDRIDLLNYKLSELDKLVTAWSEVISKALDYIHANGQLTDQILKTMHKQNDNTKILLDSFKQ